MAGSPAESGPIRNNVYLYIQNVQKEGHGLIQDSNNVFSISPFFNSIVKIWGWSKSDKVGQ